MNDTTADSPIPPADFTAERLETLQRVMERLVALAEHPVPRPEPSKYLTAQEAAAYCRVAVQTIYNNRRYIERMPGVRKLLFTRESLDTWLATRPGRRRVKK